MSATIHHWLRRASTYLNGRNRCSPSDELDGAEVVYTKNNVCVHSFDKQNNQLNHNFGYLTLKRTAITSEQLTDHKWTLCLQWTPNQCLSRQLQVNCSDEESDANNHFEHNNQDICHLEPIGLKIDDKSVDAIDGHKSDTDSSLLTDIDLKRSNSIPGHEYKYSGRLAPIRPLRSLSCQSTPLKTNLVNEESIGILNVDLKQIKSLRLFFGEDQSESTVGGDNCNGQLVIVSRHSFYKVFHFHCGGFDKLVGVLNDQDFWDKHDRHESAVGSETYESRPYLQFSIYRPQITAEECHPEEELYQELDESRWRDSVNEWGQVVGEQSLRKAIFFAGIEPSMRSEIWPFLLHRYQFDSTSAQRESDDSLKTKEYNELNARLNQMSDNERDWFWRNIESIIEKDVVRTDRSNPFFSGDHNENTKKMSRILINFAIFCPNIGYTQGMSDLLAPLLQEFQTEDKTFWCFLAMITSTGFVCSPKDQDMDHNLTLLRELLRLMYPRFHAHIKQLGSPDLELLFTHRWLLLCFKREFKEVEAMKIWESCWSHYETQHFQLFVCLAIICVYGEDVINHNMASDEMLFHFSTLSMNMSGKLILRKARGLFYEFNALTRIPCSLKHLTKADPEMWDRSSERTVECVRHIADCRHLCLCDSNDNSQESNAKQ